MLNFREWLLLKEQEDQKVQNNTDYEEDDDNEEDEPQDDEKSQEDQEDQNDEEPPQRVFPKIKKKKETLRDPEKVIKKNVKELDDECDEDDASTDAPKGTSSADIATVDNKIGITSRSLHKKLKVKKDVDNSMIPTN